MNVGFCIVQLLNLCKCSCFYNFWTSWICKSARRTGCTCKKRRRRKTYRWNRNIIENQICRLKDTGQKLPAVIFASTICAIVAYVFGFGHNVQLLKPNSGLSVTNNQAVIQKLDPFLTVAIQAKAAYVWDVTNKKVLFSKNADEPLPLASITKNHDRRCSQRITFTHQYDFH